MNIWMDQIKSFREAIWQSFTEPLINKAGEEVRFECALKDWRIAFFIDCTTQSTCRPGGGANYNVDEINECVSQVQRAFYTGYTKRHGLKFQVLWGPNGMFLSVYGSSIRENDNGMVNVSELNHYLERIMPYVDNKQQFKAAAYGDAIHNDGSCIVGRAKRKTRTHGAKSLTNSWGERGLVSKIPLGNLVKQMVSPFFLTEFLSQEFLVTNKQPFLGKLVSKKEI